MCTTLWCFFHHAPVRHGDACKEYATVLQYFTYINPMRFAIDGVRRVYIEGASLSMIASDFIPMLIVAAVTMPLAAWMFRHKLG